MNSNALPLTLTILLATCLCSCSMSSTSSGQIINNPTVDDMARYESQWGMKPRQVKPRLRQAEPGDIIAPGVQSSAPSAPPEQPLKELPSSANS